MGNVRVASIVYSKSSRELGLAAELCIQHTGSTQLASLMIDRIQFRLTLSAMPTYHIQPISGFHEIVIMSAKLVKLAPLLNHANTASVLRDRAFCPGRDESPSVCELAQWPWRAQMFACSFKLCGNDAQLHIKARNSLPRHAQHRVRSRQRQWSLLFLARHTSRVCGTKCLCSDLAACASCASRAVRARHVYARI